MFALTLSKRIAATALIAAALGAPVAQAGIGIPQKHPDGVGIPQKHPDATRHPDSTRHPDFEPNGLKVPNFEPNIIAILRSRT